MTTQLKKLKQKFGNIQQRQHNVLLKIKAASVSILMLLCLMLPTTAAQAAIYSCTQANGEKAFQDRPCNLSTPSPGGGQAATPPANQYPLDMHASWFDAPKLAPQSAYCDRLGCNCDSFKRNFRRGLSAAVVDALFLEASWHRYADQVNKMDALPTANSPEYMQFKINAEAAACDIQMSQETLINYAEQAVADMKAKAIESAARGYNDPKKCIKEGTAECQGLQDSQTYVRVVTDIRTLRSSRHTVVAAAE